MTRNTDDPAPAGASGDVQCPGYAGDPGASAPRCESYRAHPGTHFIRLRAAPATPLEPLDVWATDLTNAEEDRLAKALRNADHMNWSSAEIAARIAGTVRAIAAARLHPRPTDTRKVEPSGEGAAE